MLECERRERRSPSAARTLMCADVYELARRGLAEYVSDGTVSDGTWEAFVEAGLDAGIPTIMNSAVGAIRLAERELPDGEDDRAILTRWVQVGAPVEQYVEMMARCRRIGDPDFVRDLLVAHPEWDGDPSGVVPAGP